MTGLLRRGELMMAAALLAVFAVMVGEATRYPRDSRMFPILIGGVGLLVAALLLVRLLRGTVRHAPGEDPEEGEAFHAAPLWAALIAAPAFGIVMVLFGFWVATALCAFFGPAVMGYRSLWRRAALTLGTLAAFAILFPVVLDVSLPRGEIVDIVFKVPDDED
jgi:small-conductance mechanosensitive channel